MNNATLVLATAKAGTPASDAIVVSFNADWYDKLKKGSFSAVIRRVVPTAFTPCWLYFHMNSPIRAICARASINSLRKVARDKVTALTRELDLSALEIEDYFGKRLTVGLYEIGPIELANEPLSVSKLAERLIYYPPQSFLVLSVAAKNVIDEMGGFGALERRA